MNIPDSNRAANRRLVSPMQVEMLACLRILFVLMAPVAGYIAGSVSSASGLYISAEDSNLYEESGGEKVSFLSVSAVADDWFDCNWANCRTYVRYFNVSWSIYDGSSTFIGVAAKYLGVDFWCEDWSDYIVVNAGPANPTGSQSIPTGTFCTVGRSNGWNPYAGMCDTIQDCVYWPQYGLRILWMWTLPSTSAYNSQYWW